MKCENINVELDVPDVHFDNVFLKDAPKILFVPD